MPIICLQQWLAGQFMPSWHPFSPQRHLSSVGFHSISPLRSTNEAQSSLSNDLAEAALVNSILHSNDDEQRWQAAEQLWQLNPTHPQSPILRTKDMGLYLLGHSITLLVGILTKVNGQRLILVRLLPLGEQPYLPENLSLLGQDEAGDTVFSVCARQQDDYIQFKFTAAVGDRFTLHIGWNTASVTEQFIV